ncbi:TPA_asm: M [Zanthoxylum betacytorhabdovirus 2]|nr:TPA_asm: M [Zanthoxilum betacytorhabdovirus 2]
MDSGRSNPALKISNKPSIVNIESGSDTKDPSPPKLRKVESGISTSPSFSNKSRFKLISNEELKINYCGVISSFRGELIGKSKEDLIANYKDVLRDCMTNHLLNNSGSKVDIPCDVSILSAVLESSVESKRISDCIKMISRDFLLGENVYRLTIEAPPMQIIRISRPIRFNSNRSFSFKYNIADNNKFKFTFSGTGSMIIWKVSEDMVQGTYRVNPTVILPGTVFNVPPDNKDSSTQKSAGESSNPIGGPSIKFLSDEQKIVSNLFESVRK